MDDNDITLNDRYIDIYPHDIQICPNDCECLGINYTTNVLECDCEIKLNNDDNNYYEYELTNTSAILQYFKDFKNLIIFFSDMINYKIVKCYKLLYYLENYKNNTGFYIAIVFFIASMTLLIIFKVKGYKSIRIILYNNMKEISPDSNNKVLKIDNEKYKPKNNNQINKQLNRKKKRNKSSKIIIRFGNNNHNNNQIDSNQFESRNKKKYFSSKLVNDNTNSYNTIRNLKDENNKEKKDKINIDNKNDKIINTNNTEKIKNTQNNMIQKNEDANNMAYREINELPYFQAKNIDKRNFFKIFFSIFLMKIDLIQNIFSPEEYTSRYLLFDLYLFNYFVDLLMNCLLYNDYAISQKYHCNGRLEFITSLVISLLSNIFTYILFRIIDYLTNFTSIIDNIIREVKKIKEYLSILVKLFKIMKIKLIFLLILELLFGLFMIYYIFIFSSINSKSVNSFLLNYLLSQLESIIFSFCLSLIISFFRKISLQYHIKRLYIISIYFNEHF